MLLINVVFKRQICTVENEDSQPCAHLSTGLGHSPPKAPLGQSADFSEDQTISVLVPFVFPIFPRYKWHEVAIASCHISCTRIKRDCLDLVLEQTKSHLLLCAT